MRARLVALLAGALVLVTACDGDDDGRVETFCGEVAENVEELRADPTTDDEVDALIDLWRGLGDSAPLAIEREWDARTDNLELAWTSDDEQEILTATFAFERSGVAIATWLEQTCGIEFGPVTTIVPALTPTTSVAAATTTTSVPP